MTQKSATDEDLGGLHKAVAEGLTHIIQEGVVLRVDEESGEVIKAPAPPAYFAASIAFLKNNNITARKGQNDALDGLADALAKKRAAGKESLKDKASRDVALEQAAADFAAMAGGFPQ